MMKYYDLQNNDDDDSDVVTVLRASSKSCSSMDSNETPSSDQVLRDEANFIQNVSQFFNQEALSDIILLVGDKTFYGHKFVLAKSSDVFRTMLYEKNWSHGMKAEIDLEETTECQNVFDKFLRYLYTAEVSISNSTAVGILCLADKYNVSSLKELCIKYMSENSRSPRTRNALKWYPWAKLLGLSSLLRECSQTIAWNYSEIVTSTDWVGMDIEFLCDFLQSSELIVTNEYSIWDAVQRWLTHESHLKHLRENAIRLLPLVRFPQMLVPQLYLLEQNEMAKSPECEGLLHQLLSQAYRYRSLCPMQSQLSVSFNDPFYLPRDYTELTVDNVRMQNTLRFGIQVDVKTFRGPVPCEARDADWKLTYRKQGEVWSLQFYCHETALVNNEAHIQPTIIVYNEQERIIQVHREEKRVCLRGSTITVQLTMDQADQARNMAVLIRPVPT